MIAADGPAMATRRPGWWIPWTFVAFFVVVLIANGIMIWVALSSWTGVVDPRYYETGLRYNRLIEAAEASRALGWTARARVRVGADRQGRIVVELRDREGRPVAGAEVRGRLVRPTHEGEDVSLVLAPESTGRYVARFVLPAFGQWRLHLRARRGDDLFVHGERLFLAPPS